MKQPVIVTLVAVATSFALPSAVAMQSGDVAVTEAYVHARYELYQTFVEKVPASETAVKVYISQVGRKCPHVLAGALQGTQRFDLGLEELYVLSQVFASPDKSAALTFLNTVKRLRWSTRTVNQRIHNELQVATVKSRLPNLCADDRAWAASGYRKLPKSTITLVHSMRAGSVVAGSRESANSQDRIWTVLALYENARIRRLVRRVTHLEARIQKKSAFLLSASLRLSKRLA